MSGKICVRSERASTPARALDRPESGTALILALGFTIVVSGLVVSGTLVTRANRQKTETSFQLNSQAAQFARAGLTEGLSWFRRQTSQPVLRFEPIVDQKADPAILDSDEPEVGIVRQFRIAGKVWGRYEVWKEWDNDPDPERLAWRRQRACRDVSVERQLGSPGTAWQLRSAGYVFVRNDANRRFDESPNRVLASSILESEIRRLKLTPPGQAALNAEGEVEVQKNGIVDGGAQGIGVFLKGSDPNGHPLGLLRMLRATLRGRITGLQAAAESNLYFGSVRDVFGLSTPELQAMADDYVTDPKMIPSHVPLNSLIVLDVRHAVFTARRPLRGQGVVYVRGDVTIDAGSASNFAGMLYVDGNLEMSPPAEINGTVIVTGTSRLGGMADFAVIAFDETVLNTLRQEIGQYRMSGPIRPLISSE